MKNNKISILKYREFFSNEESISDLQNTIIHEIQKIIEDYQINIDKSSIGLTFNSTTLQESLFNKALASFNEENDEIRLDYFNPIDFINSIVPVFSNSIMKILNFTGETRNTMNENLFDAIVNFEKGNLLHCLIIDCKSKKHKNLVKILLLSKKITKNLVLKDFFYVKNKQELQNIKKHILNNGFDVENIKKNIIIKNIKKNSQIFVLLRNVLNNKIKKETIVIKNNNYVFIFNKRGNDEKQS